LARRGQLVVAPKRILQRSINQQRRSARGAEAYAVIARHLFEEVVEYAKSVCELTLGD